MHCKRFRCVKRGYRMGREIDWKVLMFKMFRLE